MNQNYFSYVNEMTEGDLESLHTLITVHYKKFIKFYDLVKEYSDIISKIEYEFNSSSALDVAISFNTKMKLDDIKIDVGNKMMNSNYIGVIEVNNKKLLISITLDE